MPDELTTATSISHFMTRSPISIDAGAGIAIAATMMRVNRFQHLPVTRDGKLIGVVSARDLLFSEASQVAKAEMTRVGDLANTDLYTVSTAESLTEVVREMSQRNIGSAVILEGESVVGIFTTTDALRILAEIVERKTPI
ncbi:MAG: CBS domain-containing protein [Bdellovibrionales bacterium]|nr:CBS domain-containing protein [Bdellovibrionales bacterium]